MVRTESSPVKYYILHETLVDEDLAMSKRQILNENISDSPTGTKLYTVTYRQVLQSFGVRNWNGRVYAKENTMKALNTNPLIQHDIQHHSWGCEYGHPIIEKGMNELARQMTIHPPNMCNTINKYWDEGNLLYGECTTVAGGYGDLLRDRILTGFPAMASSRAIGGVDKNGNVLPNYTIVTFDTVVRPSHKEAYQVPDSQVVNYFPASVGNTMHENAYQLNTQRAKDFLLSETASRTQIEMLCETFGTDYDSITINENNVKMQRINEHSVDTVIMPLNTLINTEYYNLF